MISKDTPVIILCGGKGTRISDVSQDLPKPLVPIGNNPILWHIMKTYSHYGFKNFILTLGHKGWAIKDYFLNYEYKNSDVEISFTKAGRAARVLSSHVEIDWNIKLVETGEETHTGKRVALCKDYVDSDHFMVTYGDGVSDVNINALTEFHATGNRMATVTCVKPSSRFGNIECDESGQVTEFNEKLDAGGGTINGGFFVFNREFMNIVSDCGDVMLERQPMDALVEQNELRAFMHDGFWEPMDTGREFRRLNDLWDAGKAPWKVW